MGWRHIREKVQEDARTMGGEKKGSSYKEGASSGFIKVKRSMTEGGVLKKKKITIDQGVAKNRSCMKKEDIGGLAISRCRHKGDVRRGA